MGRRLESAEYLIGTCVVPVIPLHNQQNILCMWHCVHVAENMKLQVATWWYIMASGMFIRQVLCSFNDPFLSNNGTHGILPLLVAIFFVSVRHSAGGKKRSWFYLWIYLPGLWIHNQNYEYYTCTVHLLYVQLVTKPYTRGLPAPGCKCDCTLSFWPHLWSRCLGNASQLYANKSYLNTAWREALWGEMTLFQGHLRNDPTEGFYS